MLKFEIQPTNVSGETQSELLKLIRNEIDLGFTFMQTNRLASSAEHSAQALSSAQAALRRAKKSPVERTWFATVIEPKGRPVLADQNFRCSN